MLHHGDTERPCARAQKCILEAQPGPCRSRTGQRVEDELAGSIARRLLRMNLPRATVFIPSVIVEFVRGMACCEGDAGIPQVKRGIHEQGIPAFKT